MDIKQSKEYKLALSEGWLSILSNIFLFVLKYWAGIVSGSIAIIADAWHTLSDSVSSLIVIIGIKVSAKPADKEHPLGHGRAEHARFAHVNQHRAGGVLQVAGLHLHRPQRVVRPSVMSGHRSSYPLRLVCSLALDAGPLQPQVGAAQEPFGHGLERLRRVGNVETVRGPVRPAVGDQRAVRLQHPPKHSFFPLSGLQIECKVLYREPQVIQTVLKTRHALFQFLMPCRGT